VTNRAGMAAAVIRRGVEQVASLRTSTVSRVQDWRTARAESKQVSKKSEVASGPAFKARISTAAAGVSTKVRAKVHSARQWQGRKTEVPAVPQDGDTAIDELEVAEVPEVAEDVAAEALGLPQESSDAEVETPSITTRLVTRVTPSKSPAARLRGKKPTSVLVQAQDALSAQNFQLAEDLLVAHIMKHTKDTEAYLLLGEAAMGREDWQEATEIFEQVGKWNPSNTAVHASLGLAAYKAGKYSIALQALQRAREFSPDDLEILTNLLSIAQKMDNPALQASINEKLAELGQEQEAQVPA